jgi:hypothetical protein
LLRARRERPSRSTTDQLNESPSPHGSPLAENYSLAHSNGRPQQFWRPNFSDGSDISRHWYSPNYVRFTVMPSY